MLVTCDHCGKEFTSSFSYYAPATHGIWCASCCVTDEELLTQHGFMLPAQSVLQQFGGNYWSKDAIQKVPKKNAMTSGTVPDPICDHCGNSFQMNGSSYHPNAGYVAWCADCVVADRKELDAVGVAVLADDTEVKSRGGEWWNVSAPLVSSIPKKRPTCRFAYYGVDCECPACGGPHRPASYNQNPFGY